MNPAGYLLIIVVSNWTDYQSCNAQAAIEQARLADQTLVAACIAQAPYAPAKTLRPVARKEKP